MSQELLFTSAPRGLRAGSKGGFCTVAATEGISGPLSERLESLSGYRPLFPLGDPQWELNPVLYAHWRVGSGGKTNSVLSRVAAAPADYTGRSNKLAHHLVLDAGEQSPAGPAWVLMQQGLMEVQWSGEPKVIPLGRRVPVGQNDIRICSQWQQAAGDAGWAGALAEAFILDASKPAYIIYQPGTELLPLLNEAIALLPERQRWQVTFCTYFTELPAGLSCAWRCCPVGTPAAKDAGRSATSGIVVDLTNSQPVRTESRYVMMARTGQAPEPTVAAALSRSLPPVDRDEDEAFATAMNETAERNRTLVKKKPSASTLEPAQRQFNPQIVYPQLEVQRPSKGLAAIIGAIAAVIGLVVGALGVWVVRSEEVASAQAAGREFKSQLASVKDERDQQKKLAEAAATELRAAEQKIHERDEELLKKATTTPVVSPDVEEIKRAAEKKGEDAANAKWEIERTNMQTMIKDLLAKQQMPTVTAETRSSEVSESPETVPQDGTTLLTNLVVQQLPPPRYDALAVNLKQETYFFDLGGLEATSVSVKLPKKSQFSVQSLSPDGRQIILVAKGASVGASAPASVASLKIEGGKLGFSWLNGAKAKDLESDLTGSQVIVKGAKSKRVVQFRQWLKKSYNTENIKSRLDLEEGKDWSKGLAPVQVTPIEPTGDWVMEKTDKIIKFKIPKLDGLEIELSTTVTASEISISSPDYATKLAAAVQERSQKTTELEQKKIELKDAQQKDKAAKQNEVAQAKAAKDKADNRLNALQSLGFKLLLQDENDVLAAVLTFAGKTN